MKRKTFRTYAAMALAGLLGVSLLLASCEKPPTQSPETTDPAPAESLTSPDGEATYTVTVPAGSVGYFRKGGYDVEMGSGVHTFVVEA